MRLTHDRCNTIYDILDTFKTAEYVPYKHDILELEELLKKKPTEKEVIAAYLIYATEYSTKTNVNEDRLKDLQKYLYKNLKLVGNTSN